MEAVNKTFRCVVHINKQCEVFIEAEDYDEAMSIAEDMDEYELMCNGDYMHDEPVVKKCEEVSA
tara:strand:+ start:865 stop:1056 length:192 start_codon:yes stop_codon:yes gene_type:complete